MPHISMLGMKLPGCFMFVHVQVSNEKNPRCLGYINVGDEILPSSVGVLINHWRSYTPTSIMVFPTSKTVTFGLTLNLAAVIISQQWPRRKVQESMLHVLFSCKLAWPCTTHRAFVIGDTHNLKPEIHRNQQTHHFWYSFVKFWCTVHRK